MDMIPNNLALGLIAFLLGLVIGYLIRYSQERMKQKSNHPTRRDSDKPLFQLNPQTFVMFMITLGLFVSIIAEIFIPTYKTNPMLYGVMGIIAGFFFKGSKGE